MPKAIPSARGPNRRPYCRSPRGVPRPNAFRMRMPRLNAPVCTSNRWRRLWCPRRCVRRRPPVLYGIRRARYFTLQLARKLLDTVAVPADLRAHQAPRVASDVIERAAHGGVRDAQVGSSPAVVSLGSGARADSAVSSRPASRSGPGHRVRMSRTGSSGVTPSARRHESGEMYFCAVFARRVSDRRASFKSPMSANVGLTGPLG